MTDDKYYFLQFTVAQMSQHKPELLRVAEYTEKRDDRLILAQAWDECDREGGDREVEDSNDILM